MSFERFHHAQAAPQAGYVTALAEIRNGAKRSHWIWYIFPQLAGLGRSSTAQVYALCDFDEACAYLRDPVLRDRYDEITRVVAEQLDRGIHAEILMGSSIDALKLASSFTLFRAAAAHLASAGNDVTFTELSSLCDTLLRKLGRQGYPPCQFNLNSLASR